MPRAPDLTGRALDDRYELEDVLGEGAFGRVYRGLDRRLARAVAVKVIKPWWAEDDAWVERFQREARMLARVNDPGVVQIFDIGHAEEGPYYVAELVDGESLADRLRRGPLPVEEARVIAEQLCRALASAHSEGIVHCDVKPANVLLGSSGGVKVGDFGVARLAVTTTQAPAATLAGTPRYMAPEQARGLPTTPATDVYSAGVVLYEMITGRPPFADGSPVELGLRHFADPPPPLPEEVSLELRRVVERALAKDPGERYPDGGAMAEALHAAQAAAPEQAVARAAAAVPVGSSRAARSPVQSALTERPLRRVSPRVGAAGSAAAGAATAEPQTIDLAGARARDGSEARTRVLPDAPGSPPPPAARPRSGGRRRRLLTALAGALLLTGGALAALLLTGAAVRTTVPDLRRLPRGGVEARARRLHLRPAFSRRYSDIAAGISIAQDPAAGTRVANGSQVKVVLSSGPPPVAVPGVVGKPAASAETLIANAGLRYAVTTVAAPRSAPGTVVRQSPAPIASAPRGSTVSLSVAEAPRWRSLTTFSAIDNGKSAAFSILGRRWRVTYSMSIPGTCLLLVVCEGPSAEARDLRTGSGFGGFELSEGESHTHVFNSGPGLYRVVVSGGRDSGRWTMTVQDYY